MIWLNIAHAILVIVVLFSVYMVGRSDGIKVGYRRAQSNLLTVVGQLNWKSKKDVSVDTSEKPV